MNRRTARDRRRHPPDRLSRFRGGETGWRDIVHAGMSGRRIICSAVRVLPGIELGGVERWQGGQGGFVYAGRQVILASTMSGVRRTCMSTTLVPSPNPKRSIRSRPPMEGSDCCCSPRRAAMPPTTPLCSSSGCGGSIGPDAPYEAETDGGATEKVS